MNRRRRAFLATSLATASAAAIVVAGCGGSSIPGSTSGIGANGVNGSGGSGRGESTSGSANGTDAAKAALPKSRLGVFVTATPTAAYSHVWATVLKVELLDAADKPTTIYDSPDASGIVVDLAALQDRAGGARFAPLLSAPVAGGTSITRVRLTFARAWTLFASASPTGEMMPFGDSVARDSEGKPTLSFPLSRPRDLGTGKENLVVDFDLSKMAVKDGRIIPSLHEGDTARLDNLAQQEPLVLTGVVSESAGADKESTFLLTAPDGRTAYVQTGDTVALFNDSGAASPAVSDGRRVEVRGVLSPDTKRLMASSVKVFDSSTDADSSGTASLAGPVLRTDATGGTFVVKAAQVSGLVPTQEAVTVTLAPDAVLRSRGGLKLTTDDFWSAAAKSNTRVRVEGIYEPVTGALAAARARLEDSSAAPTESHEADVTGMPAVSDEKAETLTVAAPLLAWDGLAAPVGGSGKGVTKGLPVTVTAATALRDEKGVYLSSPTFFAALKGGKSAVRVVGIYAKGTLTATRAELRPAPPTEPTTTVAAKPNTADPSVTAAKAAADVTKAIGGGTSLEKPVPKPDNAPN